MRQMLSITKRELAAYFGSPMAGIFIGAFLVSALFSFFWVETFFARNIADTRPLFRWMPLLMIFLVSALTMRQWSEEQKTGTLEILLTLPVRLSQLVMGKFLAVLILVSIALGLTLGLPLTVSMMGNIDWGPVAGGYLGAILMASSYIAIGLFVSSRTDNQIVALIVTVLLSGCFYLVGSSGITDFVSHNTGEFLRAFGTGSRFASIERGVIDLRDIVFYGSLSILFLTLNVVSLDQKRWGSGPITATYRRNIMLTVALIGANLTAANIWFNPIHTVRADLTENREYSISGSTKDLISNLTEPLILSGYFSEKTHPLLAPLVPRIKDLMEEYGVASGGRVEVSFVDPKFDEELEAEANQQFGIKPVPFQVAGRYEASVVSSYFNILIKYGDQYVTLGFNDLIEIKHRKDGQLDVGLRNLEYDLTKSIKKVVYGFQSLASVLMNLKSDIKITAVLTPGSMPESIIEIPKRINKVVADLQKESAGRLDYEIINPDEPGGRSREQINRHFGIQPFEISFFSSESFYMHLFVSKDDSMERVHLSGDISEADIRTEIEGVIKRTSSGFLKTVGLWTPKTMPGQMNPMMPPRQPADSFQLIRRVLSENYNIEEVDLSGGRVPGNVDVLLLIAPQDMDYLDRFAIDQFLMRGNGIVAMSGNYVLDLTPYSETLEIKKTTSGINEMFTHYGITIEDGLVMDKQNEPFPIPVSRNLGGVIIQEIRRMDYPFFVDVRSDGMDQENPVVAGLAAVTMNWVSPLVIDQKKNEGRKLITLLKSSPNSWMHTGTDIEPDFNRYASGFPEGDSLPGRTLAVSVQGSFQSFFDGKPDPRLVKEAEDVKEADDEISELEDTEAEEEQCLPPEPVITKSPQSSRLIIAGSSEFLNDTVISISQSLGEDRFLNSFEFLQNAIDWSVEDEDLLQIRSRGSHARLLYPMNRQEQAFWEWLNYGIALFALLIISAYGIFRRKREQPIELE
ncbi:MAG: Gldg family protein [Thermodesulfobacteriota bacterium]|nr:Gldg family protein [Thermodesulfobacteriota bacterium]